MVRRNIGHKAELLLGKNIERLRLSKKISRMQIGKKINATEQQVAKYESGEFVPLTVLEAIAEILDMPIQKRVIRRISFLRKLEKETKIEQEELLELYNAIFSDQDDE